MRLIDNKKDYYDYLAGIYGIDSYITYDRRNSVRIHNKGNNHILSEEYPWHPALFCPYKNGVEPDREYDKYLDFANREWDKPGNHHTQKFPNAYAVNSYTLGLLIGFKLYIITVYRVLEHESDRIVKIVPNVEYVKEYDRNDESIKKIKAPIIVTQLSFNSWRPYSWSLGKQKKESDDSYYNSAKIIVNPRTRYDGTTDWGVLENPILADTWIPSVIPAEEVWNNVTDYLLAIKEKPIIDNRTDEEHAESHGFDRKTSFRNM